MVVSITLGIKIDPSPSMFKILFVLIIDLHYILHSELTRIQDNGAVVCALDNRDYHIHINIVFLQVFVAINASHLVLAANEEQTIYPININEAANTSHTSFPTTYLGGTVPALFRLTYLQQGSRAISFVGCVQDVVVNNQWVRDQFHLWS